MAPPRNVFIVFHWEKKYPVPYNLRKIGFYLSVSIPVFYTSFYVFDRNLIQQAVFY